MVFHERIDHLPSIVQEVMNQQLDNSHSLISSPTPKKVKSGKQKDTGKKSKKSTLVQDHRDPLSAQDRSDLDKSPIQLIMEEEEEKERVPKKKMQTFFSGEVNRQFDEGDFTGISSNAISRKAGTQDLKPGDGQATVAHRKRKNSQCMC